MVVLALPATPRTQPNGGFCGTNNPFQTNGPKGDTEIKMIGPKDMFVRTDLPGVGPEDFTMFIDDSKKQVIIKASAPSLSINDSSPRSYETYIGLFCDCCDISNIVNPQITDGVLRFVISTNTINVDGVPGSYHEDLEFEGSTMQPNPFVTEGPDTAYEYKQLPDGSAYVRLDMPGVPKDNFITSVESGRVNVTGRAPAISHDSGGRSYSADAALLDTPVGAFPAPRLRSIVENGVVRLFINPA